ncbi:E3 ubiquitin-protein ligase RING1-like [Ricinus communis]|uniref:E3 ubiquitin-protein ligase RING1-like n=1 Tax=Ricinus communis TaxID=3988 RepID=UPI00201AA020|nr:E3 ubiquitin-protein ligase RING1-like [Ricinus communis]
MAIEDYEIQCSMIPLYDIVEPGDDSFSSEIFCIRVAATFMHPPLDSTMEEEDDDDGSHDENDSFECAAAILVELLNTVDDGGGGGLSLDPASESSPEAFKKVKEIKDSMSQCTICLDELLIGSEVVCTPCSHHYRDTCIYDWLKRSRVCPLCRFQIA